MIDPIDRLNSRSIKSAVEPLVIISGYYVFLWVIAPNLATNGLIPFSKILLFAFILYFIYLSPVLIHKDSLAARGLGGWRTAFIRIDNLSAASKYYLSIAVCGGMLITFATAMLNPLVFSTFSWYALRLKLGLYFMHALAQDLLFLGFILPRIKAVFALSAVSSPLNNQWINAKTPLVSLVCAILFASFHIPNLPLMLLVFVFGFTIAYLYLHFPNLALAVITHTILGTMLHRVLEMNLYVGPFYWHTDKSAYRTLFPALRELIGNTF